MIKLDMSFLVSYLIKIESLIPKNPRCFNLGRINPLKLIFISMFYYYYILNNSK